MISMVIPIFTQPERAEEMTKTVLDTISSYWPQYDELILVEDGGELQNIYSYYAHSYLWHDDNLGFTKNVNLGLKLATGDYIMVVNSDTWLVSGDLRDLCVPGKVTSPVTDPTRAAEAKFLNGAFFCIPRPILEELGPLDERYRMYFSDAEYGAKLLKRGMFETVPSVVINHIGDFTTKSLNLQTDRIRDQQEFLLSRDFFVI